MEKFFPLTRHHRLPQSWGGSWHKNNILMLRENTHQALHTVFADLTPIGRIRQSLEADKPALHPDIYNALNRTLQRFEGTMEAEAYEPEVIDKDTFLQKLCKKI